MARITISDKDIESLVRDCAKHLEGFLDLDYPLEVQLGHRHLTVGELVRLQSGDVVRLERPSTSYVDLVVAGKRVGTVEVLARKNGSVVRIVDLG